LGGLAQNVCVDQERHSVSVDSDSMGTKRAFSGQARSQSSYRGRAKDRPACPPEGFRKRNLCPVLQPAGRERLTFRSATGSPSACADAMNQTSSQSSVEMGRDGCEVPWAQVEGLHLESFGWARSCCRQDAEEAENVLQAVYLKIFERKAVFDGRAAFRTWLFAVIRKTAAEGRRQRFFRRLALARQREVEPAPTQPQSPERAAYLAEVRTAFRALVGGLPRRQSEVLQLVFYHDLSLSEAAAVMEVSLGSARTHYERGKRRLRAAMEGAGVR
jgi:RNA polymerase sigma factor (sigma-70 family)